MSSEVISGAGPMAWVICGRRPAEEIMRQNRHFEHRRAAEIVDQRDMRPSPSTAASRSTIGGDRSAPAGQNRSARTPASPWMPRAEFALAFGNTILLRGARYAAGIERHTDGARSRMTRLVRPSRCRGPRPARRAPPRSLYEERAGDAAGLREIGKRYIVADDSPSRH